MLRQCVSCIVCILVVLTLVERTNCELEPLPPTPGYKAADVTYDDGGMGPLFDFARSFINTALPDGFPSDFIEETINGDGFDILALAQKLLQMFKGYVAAIAVGFLFILIVPLVGVCFCCCRMCGNCGGNDVQKTTDNMHCVRRILASVVFVLTIFTLVGTICTFVSNNRMSTSLDKVVDIVDNNLDDIDTFLNQIIKEVDVIGVTNLAKTKTAISDKLDESKLKGDISAFIVNELGNGALDKLENNIKSVIDAFDAVDTALTAVNSACPPGIPCLPTSSLAIDTSTLNTFKGDDTINKVKAEIGQSMDFSAVNMGNLQNQANAAFTDIEAKVGEVRTQIKDFKSNTDDGIDIESYKDKTRTYIDTAKQFDQYRHTAGAVLAGMITLIVSLQFMGLVFGSVGQGLSTAPDQRGCVSNSGGNMLIASVAFIFIFSWILMLLTTISFSVGAILERFVCQPLSPPDFKLLKVAESQFDVTETLGAPIGSVLRDCKDGKAAFEAFHFEPRLINFTMIESQMDVQQKAIEKQMNDSLAALTGSTLNAGNAATEATNSLDQLSGVLNSINFDIVNQNLAAIPPSIRGTPYYGEMLNLAQALDHLKTFKTEVPTWKQEFLTSFTDVQTNIAAKANDLIGKFQNEILKIGRTFLDTTKHQVRHELGKCTPLWNLYDSIIIVSFCSYIVDAFNGFWFSIGWCLFFFVPSIIFSVKLAKHYRTMRTGDEEGYGNKVGPTDELPMAQY